MYWQFFYFESVIVWGFTNVNTTKHKLSSIFLFLSPLASSETNFAFHVITLMLLCIAVVYNIILEGLQIGNEK